MQVESIEQLANVPGQSRSAHLRKLVSRYADAEDFYALFNLRRYSEIKEVETRKVSLRFHELMLQWHPDKNPPARKAECEIMTVKIQYARKVLLDPDLKRRYDRELHKQAGTWSYWDWYLRWGINVVFIVGGAALVFGGYYGAFPTVGLSLFAAYAGSSVFMAGVKGSLAMWRDEDCSWKEYGEELAVGAAGLLAGGAISVIAGAVPRLLGNVAGVSADVATGTSFAERIRIAAPDVQNMPVTRAEEARLFLCRAARPLYDFELAGEPGANAPSTPPKIAEGFGQALGDLMVLAELPWMRDFEGNPSRIVDAAQALKPWKAAKPDEVKPAKGKFVKVLAVHPNGEADKLLLRETMTMAEIIETKAPGGLRALELEVLIDDFLVPPDATL
ncbi:DNAJC10, partial [Symbiodinium sp. KB8]